MADDPTQNATILPFHRTGSLSRTGDDWEDVATFYVTYQRKHAVYRTCVDHIEANAAQEWAGIEVESLCQWIQHHLVALVGAEDVREATESNPKDES
jgi:hypothetical protein